MKKIILLLLILLTVAGCSSEVNINITDGKIEENVYSYDTKDKIYPNNGNGLDEDIKMWMESFERGSYELFYKIKTEEREPNIIGKRYTATFNIDEWSYYSIIKKCYNNYNLENTENLFSIKTDSNYICGKIYGAKDVILKITTDYNVISNNADEIKDNTYIWHISDETYDDEQIIFSISKKRTNSKTNAIDEKKAQNISNIINTVLIVISIGAIITGFIIYNKVKNSNK